MVLYLVVTQSRQNILTMQQPRRTDERKWWSEAQRSYFSAASWSRLALLQSPDKWALGSRHDWSASQSVRNAQSCAGNTRAPHDLGRNQPTNTPSQVSRPTAGARRARQ